MSIGKDSKLKHTHPSLTTTGFNALTLKEVKERQIQYIDKNIATLSALKKCLIRENSIKSFKACTDQTKSMNIK